MRRIDARRKPTALPERVGVPQYGLQEFFTYMNRQYLAGSPGLTPDATFVGFVRDIAERNGVVSAAVTARALLISQVRFTWRNNRASTTPGRTFGDRNLAVLERPGSLTRSELLFLAEEDVSYSGNFYAWRDGDRLHRLRPDWITVVLGSNSEPVDENSWVPPDAQIVGYVYQEPGRQRVRGFLPDEIIHWKPEPHPLEWWRGQSWVTSVLAEIRNDGQATTHTSKFFEHAATPNLVFTMDPSTTTDQIREFAEITNQMHAGAGNAYKNLYVGGGADVRVVGSDLAALNLRDIQGGYETRIASRSRVPAVVLGIREGLHGSALNSGNYNVTRRLWADAWFSPTVQGLCAAVERVMKPAPDAELWFDASEVLFLQEDQKDAAEIAQTNASAIRSLVEAGYAPDSVVDAITTGDLTKLQHTGVFSVQLQPPTTGQSSDSPG